MARTYAIADLHGRYDLLIQALNNVFRREPGNVVLLGDYIDRGPESRQIIAHLISLGESPRPGWKVVCLKGNHEDMMVETITAPLDPSWWVGNGGGATLASYGGSPPQSHIKWMAALPLYHADGKRIFVHAGVDETLPLSEQTEKALLWSRVAKKQDFSHPEGYVVHGHTPFEDGPVTLQGRINLDTGAVWTNRLVVAVFDDDVEGGPVELIEIVAKQHEPAE
jgi:serine/threonine protein phosphatase 1